MKKTFSYIFMLFFLCGALELQANQHATDIAVVNRYKKTLLNKQDRTSLIQYLIKKNNYKSYLEIGVSNGDNFNRIMIDHKDGVDPIGNPANYQMTSDEFFAQNDRFYDIIFIDGLHVAEQVIKDVDHSLKWINPKGVIVMHDCLPQKEEAQFPYPVQGSWNGDVWKAAAYIRMHYPNVHFCVIDMDWGCGILTPNSRQTLYPSVPINELDWNYYSTHRHQLLNIVYLKDWLKTLR